MDMDNSDGTDYGTGEWAGWRGDRRGESGLTVIA